MSIIDIFSRFLFFRPLQSKESAEVAENLRNIDNEHGPPEILHSDEGTEFKGVVKTLCDALNVRIKLLTSLKRTKLNSSLSLQKKTL